MAKKTSVLLSSETKQPVTLALYLHTCPNAKSGPPGPAMISVTTVLRKVVMKGNARIPEGHVENLMFLEPRRLAFENPSAYAK
ncbi:hypothetical protein RJT34_29728 [Clitoria ternatea]|uniref:Uncharacterized protein n=1 Tax=Clitoria ternatea TaxID=43366 RepID=A0AAN9ERH3_CLITE